MNSKRWWIVIFLLTFFIGVSLVILSYLSPSPFSNMHVEFTGAFLGFSSALAAERAIAKDIEDRRTNRLRKRILEELEYIWLETFVIQAPQRLIFTPVWNSSLSSGLIENIDDEFERRLYLLHEIVEDCNRYIRQFENSTGKKRERYINIVKGQRESIHETVLKLLRIYSSPERIKRINEGENGSLVTLEIYEERYKI